ncbi:ABC transporter ATP-binding protein, partial [Pseudomonas fluorescens ABAC62]
MLNLSAVHKSRGVGSQRYSLVIPALRLGAGEQLAIVGPSGCGKSTLLDLLALVLAPDQAGCFDFLQQDIGALWRADRQSTLASLRSQHLGYVLQTGGLLGFLDVRGNIALPRQLLGLKDDGSVARLAEQLEISDQLTKTPSALSVGQRQRVSCARALAHAP